MSLPIPFIIPQTRKGIIIMFSVILAVSLIGAAVVFSLWATDQNKLKEKGQPDFNTLSADELENGLIVKGTIDLAFDTFAEAYEENYGVRTSDESELLYYVIPIYDIDADGYIQINYFMAFKAEPKHYDMMDKIMEQTWIEPDEYSELSVENGVINTLPDDLTQFFYEWADDTAFYENGSFIDWCAENNIFGTTDKNEIKSKIMPYYIDETETAGTSLTGVWVCLIFAVLSIAFLIFMKKYNKPIKGIDAPLDPGFDQLKDMNIK